MEFGWQERDDEGTKWQISARFHAGSVVFSRRSGHNNGWEDFAPTDAQWDRLISEAERRLPRRLMSTKEFEKLKGQKPS
ncbi:MAG: hypothetical protein ABUL61_00195 [Oleiharenicola lentus]